MRASLEAIRSSIKVAYHVELIGHTSRLYRVYRTTSSAYTPRGVTPWEGADGEHGLKLLLCQHPGSMAECIDKGMRSHERWLDGDEPEDFGIIGETGAGV